MSPNTLSSFVKKCSDIESGMSLTYGEISPSFIFSNTGKGGNPKYFSISLIQLIDVLTDIKQNLPVFLKHINYIEKDWRDLFSTYIKDPVVNALSTVQTLPLFALINKIIYQLNNLSNYKEKEIQLSDEYLAIAIDYLSSQKCNITVFFYVCR